MKIQCDVCNKREASLFCTADEAALCDTCDHRIHDANKLASKHQRFSLNNNSSPNKNPPLCDICQERRGFIFCQEDRAILCKECDYPIHAANEHTKNHNRFLLTGIKISLDSLPPLSSNSNSNSISTPSKASTVDSLLTINKTNEESGNFTSSSISEYLINTIPGWQFEDFIDSPSVPFVGDGFSPSDSLVSFSTDTIWVPQAASMDQQQKIGTKESNKKGRRNSKLRDDNFLVPQMSPSTPTPNKRSRFLW